MKQIISFLMLCAVLTSSVSAQNTDPWIVKAYSEIYKRQPTVEETNIKNYNNGSWGSYPELVSYIVAYNNKRAGSHIKGDPWIFQVYSELYTRVPIEWELNIKNYNSGSWSSYDHLKNLVREYQNALVLNRVQVVMAVVKGTMNFAEKAAVFIIDGKIVAADLIGNDAGSIKAVGGQDLAAKGITSLIGLDGATLIGNDAGSLKTLQGVQFSGYSLKSEEGAKKIKTAGSTTLVIQ